MITLGRTPAGRDVTLDLWAGHCLLTGRTRSGKSVLAYSILAQLRHEPPVKVVGIDPTGILFNALGEGLGGSHLRVLTLADPERVREVMSEIVAEMDRRIARLLALGRDKFGPEDATTGTPLMLVVMEEYPGLLGALQSIDQASGAKPADRLEPMVRAAVQRIGLEGLKSCVSLVLLSQRADSVLLGSVLRSSLTSRITFALSERDGYAMVMPEISPEQVEAGRKFRPGEAYADIAGVEQITRFQADFIDYRGLTAAFAACDDSNRGG